jgi:hypothetical protein
VELTKKYGELNEKFITVSTNYKELGNILQKAVNPTISDQK